MANSGLTQGSNRSFFNKLVLDSKGTLIGFLVGWIAMTLILILVSRLRHWGPGFHNPLPYALIAMSMEFAGAQIYKWLGE